MSIENSDLHDNFALFGIDLKSHLQPSEEEQIELIRRNHRMNILRALITAYHFDNPQSYPLDVPSLFNEYLERYKDENHETKEQRQQLVEQEIYHHPVWRGVALDAKQAQNELVERNLRLVIYIASKYLNRGLEWLDLIQEGAGGFKKSLDRFNRLRGTELSTFATYSIKQAIRRATENIGDTIRKPAYVHGDLNTIYKSIDELTINLNREPTIKEISDATGYTPKQVKSLLSIPKTTSLDVSVDQDDIHPPSDTIEDPDSDVATEAINNVDFQNVKGVLEQALKRLTEREQDILKRRFGLGNNPEMTLEELSKEFGVSAERIRQILQNAFKELRVVLRNFR